MDQIKQIIESLLFVSDSPLTVDHIQRAAPEAGPDDIQKALFELKHEYEVRNGGFLLHEVAGGFQFRTKKEFKEWIRRLFQPALPKLSAAAMETLAIVAYRQPVLRSEIEHIRGVNSGNSLRILLERRLVRVLGRREIPGRPLVYATTRKFLETFDLKDLKDLPSPKEIEGMEIKAFPATTQEPLEITAHETDDSPENSHENIA
jgi:segregation and condensation protein B